MLVRLCFVRWQGIHCSGSSLYLCFFPIFSFKQTRGGSYHRSYKLDKVRVSLSPKAHPVFSLPPLFIKLTHYSYFLSIMWLRLSACITTLMPRPWPENDVIRASASSSRSHICNNCILHTIQCYLSQTNFTMSQPFMLEFNFWQDIFPQGAASL